MALGIHKPGQGYWVRVMTATIVGVLTVATAAWAWSLTSVILEKYVPRSQFAMRVERFIDPAGQTAADGAFTPGQSVTLNGAADSAGVMSKIGSASVAAYDPQEKRVTLRDIQMNEGVEPAAAAAILAGDPASPSITGRILSGSSAGIMPVEPVLVKGIVASVIILIGAFLAWWLAASRVKTVEFLIATDFEMKKVNWSTPREIIGSTWVVVIACFLLSGSIFIFDVLLKNFFTLLRVLQS